MNYEKMEKIVLHTSMFLAIIVLFIIVISLPFPIRHDKTNEAISIIQGDTNISDTFKVYAFSTTLKTKDGLPLEFIVVSEVRSCQHDRFDLGYGIFKVISVKNASDINLNQLTIEYKDTLEKMGMEIKSLSVVPSFDTENTIYYSKLEDIKRWEDGKRK
jgi:hypothetical protein